VTAALRPVDPLARAPHGRYTDQLVVVTRTPEPAGRVVRTAHFELWWSGGRVHLRHRFTPARIDDDVAHLLAAELFAPGWIGGVEVFERLLTGIVLTTAADPVTAWATFYRNTLLGLSPSAERLRDRPVAFAPVHARCRELVPDGSVLELGCCFGFLALQLAAAGRRVTAADLSAGTVELLTRMAPELGLPLRTLVCDAARVPQPDASHDTVVLVHLLEHLEPAHGALAVAEALRVARRRVVVAVPYEDVADHVYGHVRTVTATDLADLGRVSGWRWSVQDHHGGWLVLDRP
jgi:2-polyprenyl-3-methyl-5-hydroxy-6-metoxy-1,4-benzoquinol methylase